MQRSAMLSSSSLQIGELHCRLVMEIEFGCVAVCVDVLNDPILLGARNTRRAAPIAGKHCYHSPARRERKRERERLLQRYRLPLISAV